MKGVVPLSHRTKIALIGLAFSVAFVAATVPPPHGGQDAKAVIAPITDTGNGLGEDHWVKDVSDWNGDGIVDGPTPINPTTGTVVLPALNGRWVSVPATGEDGYGVPSIVTPITEGRAKKEGIDDANHIPVVTPQSPATTSRTKTLVSYTYQSSLYPSVKEFKTRPKPNNPKTNWSSPRYLTPTLEATKDKLSSTGWRGPYRLKEAGTNNSWTKLKNLSETLGATKIRLKNWGGGHTLWIKSTQNGWIYAIRIVSITKIIDLANTTNAIDKVYTALKYHFNDWLFYGTFACRRIAGTSLWSQHAYGNAIDFGASSTKMRAMAEWIVARAIDSGLPVSQVIYARQVWTPEYGWKYYGGVDPHYTHVHVSGKPYLYGTPACAY